MLIAGEAHSVGIMRGLREFSTLFAVVQKHIVDIRGEFVLYSIYVGRNEGKLRGFFNLSLL